MTTTEPTPEAVEELAEIIHNAHLDPDWSLTTVARAVLAAGYETPAVMKGVMACWKVDMRIAHEAEATIARVWALATCTRGRDGTECGDCKTLGGHGVSTQAIRAALDPESGS